MWEWWWWGACGGWWPDGPCASATGNRPRWTWPSAGGGSSTWRTGRTAGRSTRGTRASGRSPRSGTAGRSSRSARSGTGTWGRAGHRPVGASSPARTRRPRTWTGRSRAANGPSARPSWTGVPSVGSPGRKTGRRACRPARPRPWPAPRRPRSTSRTPGDGRRPWTARVGRGRPRRRRRRRRTTAKERWRPHTWRRFEATPWRQRPAPWRPQRC